MSSELIDASSCQLQLVAANLCLQQTSPAECSCYESPSTFVDAYPLFLQQQFVETQGFISEVDPAFCQTASDRICEDFIANHSCCCGTEVENYRKCLFDKVLVPALPRIKAGNNDCKDTCDHQSFSANEEVNATTDDDSGSLLIIIIAAIAGLIVVVLSVALYLRYRGRSGNQSAGNTGRDASKAKKQSKSIPAGDEEPEEVHSTDSDNSHPHRINLIPEDEPDEEVPMSGDGESSGLKRPEERGVVVPKKRRSKASLSPEEEGDAVPKKQRSKKSLRSEEGGDAVPKKQRSKKSLRPEEGGDAVPKKQRSKKSLRPEEEGVNQHSNASLESAGEESTNEKLRRLRAKKEKIKSWRVERKKGSTRSLEDYLSDESLDA